MSKKVNEAIINRIIEVTLSQLPKGKVKADADAEIRAALEAWPGTHSKQCLETLGVLTGKNLAKFYNPNGAAGRNAGPGLPYFTAFVPMSHGKNGHTYPIGSVCIAFDNRGAVGGVMPHSHMAVGPAGYFGNNMDFSSPTYWRLASEKEIKEKLTAEQLAFFSSMVFFVDKEAAKS
jgi:hypothetical protein